MFDFEFCRKLLITGEFQSLNKHQKYEIAKTILEKNDGDFSGDLLEFTRHKNSLRKKRVCQKTTFNKKSVSSLQKKIMNEITTKTETQDGLAYILEFKTSLEMYILGLDVWVDNLKKLTYGMLEGETYSVDEDNSLAEVVLGVITALQNDSSQLIDLLSIDVLFEILNVRITEKTVTEQLFVIDAYSIEFKQILQRYVTLYKQILITSAMFSQVEIAMNEIEDEDVVGDSKEVLINCKKTIDDIEGELKDLLSTLLVDLDLTNHLDAIGLGSLKLLSTFKWEEQEGYEGTLTAVDFLSVVRNEVIEIDGCEEEDYNQRIAIDSGKVSVKLLRDTVFGLMGAKNTKGELKYKEVLKYMYENIHTYNKTVQNTFFRAHIIKAVTNKELLSASIMNVNRSPILKVYKLKNLMSESISFSYGLYNVKQRRKLESSDKWVSDWETHHFTELSSLLTLFKPYKDNSREENYILENLGFKDVAEYGEMIRDIANELYPKNSFSAYNQSDVERLILDEYSQTKVFDTKKYVINDFLKHVYEDYGDISIIADNVQNYFLNWVVRYWVGNSNSENIQQLYKQELIDLYKKLYCRNKLGTFKDYLKLVNLLKVPLLEMKLSYLDEQFNSNCISVELSERYKGHFINTNRKRSEVRTLIVEGVSEVGGNDYSQLTTLLKFKSIEGYFEYARTHKSVNTEFKNKFESHIERDVLADALKDFLRDMVFKGEWVFVKEIKAIIENSAIADNMTIDNTLLFVEKKGKVLQNKERMPKFFYNEGITRSVYLSEVVKVNSEIVFEENYIQSKKFDYAIDNFVSVEKVVLDTLIENRTILVNESDLLDWVDWTMFYHRVGYKTVDFVRKYNEVNKVATSKNALRIKKMKLALTSILDIIEYWNYTQRDTKQTTIVKGNSVVVLNANNRVFKGGEVGFSMAETEGFKYDDISKKYVYDLMMNLYTDDKEAFISVMNIFMRDRLKALGKFGDWDEYDKANISDSVFEKMFVEEQVRELIQVD